MKSLLLFLITMFCWVVMPVAAVRAVDPNGTPPPAESKLVPCPNNRQELCLPLENPLPQTSDTAGTSQVTLLMGIIIKAALGIIGSLALLMLVWGGFQWLISAGNPEKITQGTQTMLWAAIGVVLVLASYIILNTFIEYLTGAK